MNDNTPLIETRDVTRILPLEVPVTLVKNINMSLTVGEFISVTGPSGSGKSSLLYLLGLIDRPTAGEVLESFKKEHDKNFNNNEDKHGVCN